MPTRQRNFILYLGDDFSRRLNLVPGPDSDIEGWDGEMVIVDDVGSTILSATTDNERLSAHNGYLEINIAAAITAAVETSGLSRTGTLTEPANNDEVPYSGTGHLARYYLRVISPGGVITRLLDGQFVFVE